MNQPFFTAPRTRDLNNFADNLDIANFKALSSGIGLGELKTALPKSKQPQAEAAALGEAARPMSSRAASKIVSSHELNAAPPTARAKGEWRLRWDKKVLAFGLDLFFVTATLALALASAALAQGLLKGGPVDWFESKPLKWLGMMEPVMLLAGIYGVYFIYYLAFKCCRVRTFGESFFVPVRLPSSPNRDG